VFFGMKDGHCVGIWPTFSEFLGGVRILMRCEWCAWKAVLLESLGSQWIEVYSVTADRKVQSDRIEVTKQRFCEGERKAFCRDAHYGCIGQPDGP